MNSEQEKKLYEYLDKVEKAQEELDRKTQRAEVYREYNIKLFSIIKIGIIGFIVFLTLSVFILGSSAVLITQEYFNYEQNISRSVTTETDDISTGGNGMIFNRSNGVSVNGKPWNSRKRNRVY